MYSNRNNYSKLHDTYVESNTNRNFYKKNEVQDTCPKTTKENYGAFSIGAAVRNSKKCNCSCS